MSVAFSMVVIAVAVTVTGCSKGYQDEVDTTPVPKAVPGGEAGAVSPAGGAPVPVAAPVQSVEPLSSKRRNKG